MGQPRRLYVLIETKTHRIRSKSGEIALEQEQKRKKNGRIENLHLFLKSIKTGQSVFTVLVSKSLLQSKYLPILVCVYEIGFSVSKNLVGFG